MVARTAEDALADRERAHPRARSAIRHTHMKKESPLTYALKCVIRLFPSRF